MSIVAYSAEGVLGGAGLDVATGEIIFTGVVGGLTTVLVLLLSQGADESTVLVLLSFPSFDLTTLSPVKHRVKSRFTFSIHLWIGFPSS